MNFQYTFTNVKNLFSELGGVGKLAEETLGASFGTILLILFFVDLVYIVKKRHSHDHREHTIHRIARVLPVYQDIARQRSENQRADKSVRDASKQDLESLNAVVNKIEELQGDKNILDTPFVNKLTNDEAKEMMKQLLEFEKTYGAKAQDYLV